MPEKKKYKKVKLKEAIKFINEVAAQISEENEGKELLKRELRQMALDKVERAAKTELEFERVIAVWDLLDYNREEMDKDYLVPLGSRKTDDETGISFETDGIICTDTVFPTPYVDFLHTRYWRQVISGNFHDYLHDCVHKIHLSVSNQNVSKAIEQLTDNQKEIFYMVAIEEKTPLEIARYKKQTPRNIRKVKYSDYEYKKGNDGHLYIVPADGAKPKIYDPFANIEEMIIDALNVNPLGIKKSEDVLKKEVLEFVKKYGLLGFMTAFPTTPDFMDYNAVYFPKNEFIEDETMSTQDFIDLFFPFKKPDYYKDKRTAHWNITDDVDMMALALTMSNLPMALNISLGRDYSERYDWLAKQFKNWAFTLTGTILFYLDKDTLDEATKHLYRKGMSAFKGISPTYHVELFDDKPMVVWDFHSLLLCLQMMFSFMLTDEKNPLRICKHCQKTFYAAHPNAVFCGHACKNKYNVYKSRGRE